MGNDQHVVCVQYMGSGEHKGCAQHTESAPTRGVLTWGSAAATVAAAVIVTN